MSYHENDNTMDVIVAGKPARRTVAHVERHRMDRGPQGERHFMHVYMPELLDEEDCVWTIGSDVPTIVQVRPARGTCIHEFHVMGGFGDDLWEKCHKCGEERR